MLLLALTMALINTVGGLSGMPVMAMPCPMHDMNSSVDPAAPCCPDCLPDGMTVAACMSLCAQAPAILNDSLPAVAASIPLFALVVTKVVEDRQIRPEPLPPKR